MTFTIVHSPHTSTLEYVHEPKDSEKFTEFTTCIFFFKFSNALFFQIDTKKVNSVSISNTGRIFSIRISYIRTEISNSLFFYLQLVTKLSTQAKQVQYISKHCCLKEALKREIILEKTI